ncbi:Asp-tRNAAsn/Glu-tRNAGln amidotransferase A subunit [Blastococcus aurantiacus]|uniref:Asp-tRNAAsn/Glu-tRNAGln amidotransferase A subunit n=1 Tax=Blastococcus aurantiacus TaxID=1550231 RepID=A0A1G7QVS0_9ACTN|nr:AtzH-like domain-containing protein [Blastococcus aurantiacus]SDG02607.1 Asp-tRNAAsn/Glu-tRNAGln amidotransferase A subunit [Blastococcus aurantiacus]
MTGPAPECLLEAFRAYEAALMADDVATLDELFAPGADTLRADGEGVLVGHDRIAEFRATRGGAPGRTLAEVHVRAVDQDSALVVAGTVLDRGGRGLQTQLWQRSADRPGHGGWRITAAHVSVSPPALDARVWRAVGDPLVPPSGDGPLTGQTVAVKDLYAVAGHAVGAGNPARLADAAPEPAHAGAVGRLLGAGAAVRGIARTDEFAYSLAGTNAHYGTPPNPAAPYRVPGGSSSGSASAVALGHATIGLGTDTGGSIRVPAAYQGLYGIRTTHGAVDRSGLLPLAADFDAVGWLTRSPALLAAVGDVLLPAGSSGGGDRLVFLPGLVDSAEPDVRSAVRGWLADAGATELGETLDDLDAWRAAFQTWQGFQAWQAHGPWLADRMDVLGPDVRSRFETAAAIDDDAAGRARALLDTARSRVLDLVGDRVLVLPSAPSVAPLAATGATPELRNATMRLTCLAALAGLPAVSLPVRTGDGLPAGVCLVAAPGRDRALLDLVQEDTRT